MGEAFLPLLTSLAFLISTFPCGLISSSTSLLQEQMSHGAVDGCS